MSRPCEALTIAEAKWDHRSENDLFDLIQDANGALVDALATFDGREAREFTQYIQHEIVQRLGQGS